MARVTIRVGSPVAYHTYHTVISADKQPPTTVLLSREKDFATLFGIDWMPVAASHPKALSGIVSFCHVHHFLYREETTPFSKTFSQY